VVNQPDSYLQASPRASILVLDDEASVLTSLKAVLSQAGYQVESSSTLAQAIELSGRTQFDLFLCDIHLPDGDGLQFLERLKQSGIPGSVVMMSAIGSSAQAIEAIKLGASDYIAKPFTSEDLLLTLKIAEQREMLRRENELLRAQVSKRYSFSNIIGESAAMSETFETIKKIADYRTTVMIYGESGTGKELVARAIHYNSNRRAKRFVAINCGAIPQNLLESELFGHKRGAFTDATRDKKGLFEEAHEGTILLDEIGELPTHLQVKLLRVLQENEIRPVGDNRIIPIDVRVVAATLRDLESDVLAGRFRDDLFYRLNVIALRIPALRERKEDIPLLVSHFLKKNQERFGLPVFGIDKDAMELLIDYDWPGNVRELENCIERAMILTDSDSVKVSSLPRAIVKPNQRSSSVSITDDQLSIKHHARILEDNLIRRALEKTGGNRTHAAKLLEISHRTLLYKLKEYGLADKDEEAVTPEGETE
jgi:two-component system response regulator AtoC